MSDSMVRVVIRAHGRGPLGFVRMPTDGALGGITLSDVRNAIAEQLFEVMPDEAYVFLLEDSGVPVAPSQEANERAATGMTYCCISFFSESRTPAAGIASLASLAAGAAGAAAGVCGADARERASFSQPRPSHSTANQWITSFASMEPREQHEAMSYLQRCFPTDMAAIGASAEAALGKASDMASEKAEAAARSSGEQQPQSLDQQLLEMFRAQLCASTSSTGSLQRVAKSPSKPFSPLERGFDGFVVGREPTSDKAQQRSDSKFHHGTLSSSLRVMEHNTRNSHSSSQVPSNFSTTLRDLKGHPMANAANSPIRAGRKVSTPTRAATAPRVDKPESPFAFGSSRPQRPDFVSRMGTSKVVTIGGTGSVRGIF